MRAWKWDIASSREEETMKMGRMKVRMRVSDENDEPDESDNRALEM